jgi:hypothetical protein
MKYTVTLALVMMAAMTLSGCIWIFDGIIDPFDAELAISLEWDTSMDIDLCVTYPYPPDGNTIDDYGEPKYTEVALAYTPAVSGGDDGFFPEDGPAYREEVSQYNTESSFGLIPAVEMTEQNLWGGPDVVVVRQIPFTYNGVTYLTDPNAANGLPAGSEYAWVGVMEVYVDGDGWEIVSSDGSGANAVVTIYDSSGNPISVFPLPAYTDIESASVARINLFVEKTSYGETYEFYQILPDLRIIRNDELFPNIVGRGGVAGDVINVRGRQLD